MNISCPVLRDKGARRCDGELEVELERTSNGDGVWAESGWAVLLPCDANDDVYCSEGCKLNLTERDKVEEQALEAAVNGY